MRTEDLQTVSEIGAALWADREVSRRVAIETIAAVSLMDLTSERKLERMASAMLGLATRRGTSGNLDENASALARPFYRMSPEQRFVLVALHTGRWSYARLTRVMRRTPEQVQDLAWQARIQLATDRSGGKPMAYPVGSPARGARCPEFNPARPWTQRFLDEEFSSGTERLFLQNHLMACDPCRRALNLCRDVYYRVDGEIPRREGAADLAQSLERAYAEGQAMVNPASRTFWQSLRIFTARPDIFWGLVGFAALVGWRLLHKQ